MRHRFLIVLAALALFVTACAEDDTDPSLDASVEPIASESVDLFESEEPSPTESAEVSFEASFEASESPEESFDADESESPDASASPTEDDGIGGDDGLTASCEDAFDEVPDLTRIDSLQDLEDVLDGLEMTIESCESVDAWTEAAQEQLSLANIDIDARDFLERQCEDEDLADAPLCTGL